MITLEYARRLRRLIEKAAVSLDDESALSGIELFPAWQDVPPMDYVVGDRVRYGNTLYKCVQSHTSQSDWTPDATPALWVVVSLDEWPEWRQPTGAHDAYNTGDKVSHNGLHWTSMIDANTYEPGVYGWLEA